MSLVDAIDMVAVSHAGRVREHNEDSIACSAKEGIAVLADGMGGYKAGEVASAVAATSIYQEVRASLQGLVRGQTDHETGYRYESLVVRDAVVSANRTIREMAGDSAEFSGMGTTVVAALLFDNRITLAHVGDSRAYRWRDQKLAQLTVDHTVVQARLDSGLYSLEEARASNNKNLVTRALGLETEVKVDIAERDVRPQDVYILCSDGLTDLVDEEKIAATLERNAAVLEKAAHKLVSMANSRGGTDNISVVLIRVKQEFALAASSWQTKMAEWFTSGS